MKLQFVGGGKMAEALLGGLVAGGWAQASELHVVEPNKDRWTELTDAVPGLTLGDVPRAEVDAVIAVKPNIVGAVLPTLADCGVRRVASIAAGVTIASLEAGLGAGAVVLRVMPNTPALVGEGMAGIAAGTNAGDEDVAWATSILQAVGQAVTVTEPELEGVTAISGCGPAYVFRMAEALTAAGIAQGLTPEVSDLLARQTLLGAATLLDQSDLEPSQLRENVTSPGGATQAALNVMNHRGFMEMIDAMADAAVARSRELGQ